MDESPIKSSTGDLARWGFIIMMTFSMVLFPHHRFQQELRPVVKGPRPHTIRPAKEDPNKKEAIVIKPNKRERRFHSIILNAADKHRIDPALVKAVIMAESGYDPYAISKKGAMGLMQLMPATADALGVEDAFDPVHNIDGGVKYLKQLLNMFGGDLRLAIAAYNAGIKKVKKYQGIPPFKATHKYVKKVFAYYKYYKRQCKRQGNII